MARTGRRLLSLLLPLTLAAGLCGSAPLFAADVNATLLVDPAHAAGTDSQGRVLLYAPNPVQPGSSISHFDASAAPNLLMEPSASSNLSFLQIDLTRPLLQDMGWPGGSSNAAVRYVDLPGVGFNHATLGAQRRAAIELVANTWDNLLGSSQTINLEVSFEALDCDSSSAVLAQAVPQFIFESFAGAPVANTWYPGALAESLSGQNLSLQDDSNPNAGDLKMTFNSRIDEACLGAGTGFHYGLDGNLPGGHASFVNVALHEMAHGLGFASFANERNGTLFMGLPDAFTRFIFDETRGLHWHQMSNGERQASAVNSGHVAWSGERVTAQAPAFLQARPTLRVNSPASVAGFYLIGTATFGPALSTAGVTGDVAIARDGSAEPTLACGALVNGAQVSGKIALIDRGTCNFVDKVRNAQNAGARGVIMVNNVSGSPPGMSGTDPAITIPTVSVTLQDGNRIKAALAETDPAGTLRLSAATYAASEGAGSAAITVVRSGGSNGQVSVAYATSNGTATAGADYTATSGTVTFAAGEEGSRTFQVPIVDDTLDEDPETVRIALSNATGGATLGEPRNAVLTIDDNEQCTPDERTLCLRDGRFRVRVDWTDFEGNEAQAQVVDTGGASDDSGLFWFLDADNWELLVKVVRGCGDNSRYWVFAAATTNVGYTLRVTDTLRGGTREYVNPVGTQADAITDTDAFATCP